jgi:hypothetical protein
MWEGKMSAFVHGFRLLAGLAMVAAMQPATAQGPQSEAPVEVSSRGDCPIEQHPKAINPDVIECHARFAPLPSFPDWINVGNAQHLEVMRSKADALLEQIARPEACGEGAQMKPQHACAILVYVLDPEYRQGRMPWTYLVRIYRTNWPEDGDLRRTAIKTVASNDSLIYFGPVGAKDEVWKLLADQRVAERCNPGTFGSPSLLRNTSASLMSDPERCVGEAQDVRYRPALLIGRQEAEMVLNPKAVRFHFGP